MELNQNGKVELLSSSWAAKAQTKYEIYILLVTEAKVFLPKCQCVTVYYLKEIVSGKKKHVKQHQIRHIFVPHYEGLALKDIFETYGNLDVVCDHFPDDPKEIRRFPKQWIVNLLATIIGSDFDEWIKQNVVDRNKKRIVKANKLIEVDPDIFQAFQEASSVSLTKGAGVDMLKMNSKRRRTKAQKEEDDLKVQKKEDDIAAKMSEFSQMQQKIQDMQQQINENQESANLIQNLASQGVISFDEGGNVQVQVEHSNQMEQN